MFSPSDPASFPEPLPSYLKALLELEREAHADISTLEKWREFIRENWLVLFLAAVFVFIQWRSHDPTVSSLGMLVIVYLVQAVSDQWDRRNQKRARRQLRLLLDVIHGLQRPATPANALDR